MKKVSTVATKQSRNFSQPKLTIGLDLGDRNSGYCVLDEGGRSNWNSESVRRRKRCRKGLAPRRAAESRWRREHIRRGSVAC